MTRRENIADTLTAALHPERLEVIDESHMHAGHQESFDGSGETHFRVRIISAKFAGMGRVERHRTINALLQPEIDAGLHALAIEPSAPGEPTRW